MTSNSQPSMFGQEAGASEAPASPPTKPIKEDQFVDMIMYALTGPLVGYPGWESLLEDHRTEITMYRLAHSLEIFREKQATEYEAMLYISTSSLAYPIDHDWAAIYGYLFCKLYPEQGKAIWEDDLDHKMNANRQEMLAGLRSWLFNTQMKRLRHEKDEEAPTKPRATRKAQKTEVERPRMF